LLDEDLSIGGLVGKVCGQYGRVREFGQTASGLTISN
jgi:hypothetical protein